MRVSPCHKLEFMVIMEVPPCFIFHSCRDKTSETLVWTMRLIGFFQRIFLMLILGCLRRTLSRLVYEGGRTYEVWQHRQQSAHPIHLNLCCPCNTAPCNSDKISRKTLSVSVKCDVSDSEVHSNNASWKWRQSYQQEWTTKVKTRRCCWWHSSDHSIKSFLVQVCRIFGLCLWLPTMIG